MASTRLKDGSKILAAAVVMVGAFEGLRTHAYIPIPGDVPTICFGETRGVKMGDTATVEECKAMLGQGLQEFEAGMRRCLLAPDFIPDNPYVSMLSLAYNIGTPTFCTSTVARKANLRDYVGACNAIPAFNKMTVGGKRKLIPGLVARRERERAYCLKGL